MRKTFLPAVLLAACALAGVGFAVAQGEEPPGPPDHMMMAEGGPGGGPGDHHFFMRHHRPGEHLEGHLAFIKTELQIKPAQQKAWDDFAAAAHQSVKIATDAMPQPPNDEKKGRRDRDDWTPPPVPERLDRAEKMLNVRLQILHTMAGPTKALYASLDDTQKKTADEILHPMR